MKKLKIGIIGSGFGLNCHLPSFRQNKNCEVLALCSKKCKQRAKISKKKWNKKLF